MESKNTELMLKNPYPSMIKVEEKQERRTHAKKSLSKYIKVDEKQEQELMLKNPYPSMIKVDEKQERRTHAKNILSKHNKSE